MGRLGANAVELQRGGEAADTSGHPLGGFHQREVVITVEVGGRIQPGADPADLIRLQETAKVFARIAGGHKVAGTKNP